jgi:hypothetical protein
MFSDGMHQVHFANRNTSAGMAWEGLEHKDCRPSGAGCNAIESQETCRKDAAQKASG